MPTPTAIALQETATSLPLATRPAVAETRTPPPTQAATEPPPSLPGYTLDGLTELDDRLAQRTAESFVERLKKGEAASAFRLLLTQEAQQGETGPWLMQFAGADSSLADAVLLDLKRATATSYEAQATIRWMGTDRRGPATQVITLTLAYQRGLWLIDRIGLGDLQVVSPTATPRRATASATETPQLEGRLVFQVSSGGPIYVINADGSALRRLTDGLDPAWSPDGKDIAFTRWRNPWGVYLIKPDGSDEKRLVDGAQFKEVAWSADGSTVAVTINSASAEPIEICFFGFCFTLQGPSLGQMWTANLDDGALLSLPLDDRAVHAPTWSPVENRIVYAGDRGLSWIDLDTMKKGHFDGGSAWDTSPTFSPDGRQVAFMGRVHDHWEVFVMNANGSGRQQLTYADPGMQHPANSVAPTWSPDGESIAFLSDRDGVWRIYVMGVDGSGQRAMFGDKLDGLGIRYEWATERVVSWSR
jgi:hypothetical protein